MALTTILFDVLGLYIFPIFCLCLHWYLKHPPILYLNLTVLISFLIYWERKPNITKIKKFLHLWGKVWTLVLQICGISVFIYTGYKCYECYKRTRTEDTAPVLMADQHFFRQRTHLIAHNAQWGAKGYPQY